MRQRIIRSIVGVKHNVMPPSKMGKGPRTVWNLDCGHTIYRPLNSLTPRTHSTVCRQCEYEAKKEQTNDDTPVGEA
jgi:hypothetical protein